MGQKNGKLKPEEISDLVSSVDFSEEEVHDFYKDFKKDCPNGKLRIDDFMKIYSNFFPYGDASKFAQHVFRTFDENGDGFIDFREFLCAMSVTCRGSTDQKLNWAFNMYDLNSDGFITKQEMLEMIKAIYKMVGSLMPHRGDVPSPEQQTQQIFDKLDLNKDGMISKDEFIHNTINNEAVMSLLKCELRFEQCTPGQEAERTSAEQSSE